MRIRFYNVKRRKAAFYCLVVIVGSFEMLQTFNGSARPRHRSLIGALFQMVRLLHFYKRTILMRHLKFPRKAIVIMEASDQLQTIRSDNDPLGYHKYKNTHLSG